MAKYGEILRLAAMGVGQNSIAFSCGCAQSTVSDVLRAARAHRLSRPLPEEMDDAAIRAVVYPKESRKSRDKAATDHESVASEPMRRGMTMSLLRNECCDAAIARGEEPCMYSAFCRERRDWAQRRDVRMRIERRAAEAVQVDWVGGTGEAIGPDAGEIPKAYVFAACPPRSNYLYAEGFYKTDEGAWIAARAHTLSLFGGSAPILVPDNCRTAITRDAKEALTVNEQHRRMSEHHGCAAVPARVRKPRDKASAETGVGVIGRRAMMALRKRRSMSPPDFNRALIAQVMAISSRPFRKREGSRESIFLGQEEPMLIPLPGKPYEMPARKEATVDFNCRAAFGGAWCSAPSQYVKRAVAVAATPRSASVMCDGKRIAIRERAPRKGDYRADPNHMPDAHRGCAEWNGGRFRKWAAEIGGVNREGGRRHPLVPQGRAAVLPLVPRRAGAGEGARKGPAGGSVRQGAAADAAPRLQGREGRPRRAREGARGGRRRRRLPARQRVLRELRQRRRTRGGRGAMASGSTMDEMHRMRPSAMAGAYREQEDAPGIAEMGFDERLAMIVDAERDARRASKRMRLLRQAGFPEPDANVDDVRYDDDRELDRSLILELSDCGWIRNHRNVLVAGASGAGKTWISNALGVAACDAFFTVRCTRLPELLDELTVFKDGDRPRQRKKYIECDLPIIDDWLLEKVKSNEARETMEVVEARDRTGSLIPCSQFAPSAWRAKLGNGAIADAVIDRVVYKSHVMHIEGEESMRKRMGGIG